MLYSLFGWWIRWQACKMAAQVFQSGAFPETGDAPAPRLWSVTVFFERYMQFGANETAEEFGPKVPVDIKAVKGA